MRAPAKSEPSRFPIVLLAVALLALSAGAAFADGIEESLYAPSRPLAKAALERLQADHPQLRAFEHGGRITRLYGAPFAFGSSPEDAAERFCLDNARVLSVEAEDLEPHSLLADARHTQPVMYDEETGEYRFTLVYYTQYRNGVPVFRSDLRLLVLNQPDHPVVMAASALRDLGSFQANSRLGGFSATAEQAARNYAPGLTDFTDQETVIWAGVDGEPAEPRVAVTFVGTSDFPERYLFVIDPLTGEILYSEDQIIFEDVSGTVEGLVTQGRMAEQCEEELAEPMPFARIEADGEVTYTDIDGNYTIDDGGNPYVAVTSPIRGEWFRVYNYTGTDSILSVSAGGMGTASFLHNPNNSEPVRAQANAYIEANEERLMVIQANPSYPSMSQNEFPIYVNRTDGYCPGNAWYDYSSMNFCSSGSGYPNTAWGSILHHEYGHHLVSEGGSGQGQYGEGMGDCMSMLMADHPELAVGFYGNCTQYMRTGDNTFQYPCDGEIHYCGQLLSGCVWDTREELILTEPDDYLDILADLTINSILLHSGTEITPQITIDFLTLDDTDGNLDNGTPHYYEIAAGFGAHNMPAPELQPITFTYPNGIPETVYPETETTVEIEVAAQPGLQIVPGSVKMHYTTNGIGWSYATLTEVAADLYEAVLPAVDCDGMIHWYVEAEEITAGMVYDPEPSSPREPIIATSQTVVFEDNFNTSQGWTVSGDATDGQWGRGNPVGGGDRGDPADDFDGSGYCYLTDNVDGNSDVDGGTTRLYSPVFDLSAGDAIVHYARWFSNNTGDGPNEDIFRVFISDNGGSTWTQVDSAGPVEQASGSWYEVSFQVSNYVTPTADMQMRFDASDLGAGSIVEAGVDDFVVTQFECEFQGLTITTGELPDWTVNTAYAEQLAVAGATGEVTWSDKYGDLSGTGLDLLPSGELSGTPTTVGDISFTAAVIDEGAKDTDEKPFTFTVNPAVAIVTVALPDWTVGAAYSETVQASGGTGVLYLTDKNGDLAGTGLSMSPSGAITGTPTVEGTINLTVVATDQVGAFDETALPLMINPALEITTTELPDAYSEQEYSTHVSAAGGTGTVSFGDMMADLAAIGLTVEFDGHIHGTPATSGDFGFTLIAVDQGGGYDQVPMILTVVPTLSILTETVPDWTVGIAYSVHLESTGGSGAISWADKNGDLLGTGLELTHHGFVSGTPLAAGEISFTAQVSDEGTQVTEQPFGLTINPAVEITTETLPEGGEEVPYSQALAASGGTAPLTWIDRDGDLAGTGLTLSGEGVLSGTPTVNGDLSFTAQVTGAAGSADEQLLALHLLAAYICGDIDGSEENVNVADLVFLVNFMFKDGTAPPTADAADVNATGTLDVADLVYLVNYMFKQGPDPNCP